MSEVISTAKNTKFIICLSVLWNSTRNISPSLELLYPSLATALHKNREIARLCLQENGGLFEHLLKIKDFNLEPELQPEEWLKFALLFFFYIMRHEFVFVDEWRGGGRQLSAGLFKKDLA